MIAPGDLAVVSYNATSATHYTAKTASGRTYYVVVVEEAGLALVQPAGRQGWAEVSLADLVLGDVSGLQLVAAAIEDSFAP